MNAREIARTLAQTIFPYRRHLIVPNVSWGLLPWEADLLIMSGSGYLYEVEIKISIADLKREAKKKKWSFQQFRYAQTIRGMWYAMPREVWEHKDANQSIAEHAGVIVVDPTATRACDRACVVLPCKPNRLATPASSAERFQLARLGAMRYWASKEAA